MVEIGSPIVDSAQTQENEQFHRQLIDQWQQALAWSCGSENQEAKERHQKRGRLLVWDRINLLKDPGTAVLEIAPLAAYQMYDGQSPGAGVVAAIAMIHQKPCMVVANDPTVKGGTYFPLTVKKHLRAQEIAATLGLPCIYLVDSGGAYLPLQSEVFPDRFHFGRIFYNQALMSSQGIPQISVVLGSCTAGGAYVPAMSDETIIVRRQGTIFLGGPPLVKAATGHDVTPEELGGGDVHTRISGVADHLAESESEALALCRDIVFRIPMPMVQPLERRTPQPPKWPVEDVLKILPKDARQPFDVREIIARLVDASVFHEFKPLYGETLVTGFAHIEGYPVGIVANNGVLFSESALKGAHFIDLCDQRRIPIVFLQNITGFMVGKEYEHEGIAKHGAKMVQAVSLATVPKITVIIGNSYGAGNYAMCGRAYDPIFLWSWPNARIAVMGGKQAAEVLWIVKNSPDQSPEAKKSFQRPIEDQFERESHALYASARLWDDGIIHPLETRRYLAWALYLSQFRAWLPRRKGVYRM